MSRTGQLTLDPAEVVRSVSAAKRGNSEAFGTLYDAYVDRLFRYVRFRVANETDAEDLTEQVFVRAWQALSKYEDRGRPFVAWLYAIAGNVVADHFRAQKPRAMLDDNLVDSSASSDPVGSSERENDRRDLASAIRRLSDDQQKVVVMRFIEGMSPGETAEAIGKREGTVRVIQHRALAALRSILEAVGGES